jgi:hypothetical protein
MQHVCIISTYWSLTHTHIYIITHTHIYIYIHNIHNTYAKLYRSYMYTFRCCNCSLGISIAHPDKDGSDRCWCLETCTGIWYKLAEPWVQLILSFFSYFFILILGTILSVSWCRYQSRLVYFLHLFVHRFTLILCWWGMMACCCQ